ncbi:hypothetical protein RCH14_004755 [Massilia sp. MP_M2]
MTVYDRLSRAGQRIFICSVVFVICCLGIGLAAAILA